MQNHGQGTHNDKLFVESAAKNIQNTQQFMYLAHQFNRSKYFF